VGKGCKHCKNGRRQIAVWHIQFSHRGKQYRESSKSTRKVDATRLLKKRMSELGADRKFVGPQAEKTTFEDLVQFVRDDYRVNGRKSTKRLTASINQLSQFFNGFLAIDITTDVLTRYINRRFEEGRATSTARNEVNVLRRGFKLAHQAGKVRGIPHFPRLTVDTVRQGFFEEDEFNAVLAELPEWTRPVADFGYCTGWRVGEILPLRWSQVDFKAGTIRLEVGSTKNNDGRVLPFHVLPRLKALMERQLAYTEAVQRERGLIVPHVFHRNGRPLDCIRNGWDAACERTGYPEKLFHDLRRTAVRNLERAGVPRSIAMKITGHKTEAVYRRYAIVNEADVAEGLARLAGWMDKGAG